MVYGHSNASLLRQCVSADIRLLVSGHETDNRPPHTPHPPLELCQLKLALLGSALTPLRWRANLRES